ncbi:SH3 domain-containing protein [Nitrosospira sp. Nsp5]|uniref:SH3 domain-containing protein n=3 Tax=Nitrosomonadaceae TaxID=206379 RepID=A0ABY0T9W4_9PROT|nr:SH3 domain-containing protein [Nitrosospira sp. Nsp5]SCY00820.1 SH3 domain-containing protein [Nitrosospira sp. Nsp13]SDQ50769.1 SH3 domain-containing protein [Nitrosospira multiformis]
MKGFSIQMDKPYRLPQVRAGQMLCWIALVLLGLNMMGCSLLLKSQSPELPAVSPESNMKEQQEIERMQKLLVEKEAEKEAQQQEIERLQKILVEKEAQIRVQQARQQDQAKTLQETSSQAVHAQVKLRRLATRPAAASTIAEAEVAMENLKSSPFTESEQVVQSQAQRLLSAAAASYAEDNHVAAMEYAAYARGLIDMIKNNRAFKTSDSRRVTTPFEVPIPLRAATNSNLRQNPALSAAVLSVAKKDSLMTAEAYQGDWLRIQTADGQSGWVLNTLVEAQVGK